MTYISGTINNASSAAALYAAMSPALSSAGFTLVDTVVISTRTHKVWKSAASNNATGLDWYVDVAYQTVGSSNVWLSVYEDYDATNHLGIRGAIFNANFTLDGTYYSRYGATGYSLESANWFFASQYASAGWGIQTSASSFGYWISISGDRIAAITSVNPTDVAYAGFIAPSAAHVASAGSALYPLWAANLLNGSNYSYVQMTRYPKLDASMTVNPRYHTSWANVNYLREIFGGAPIPTGSNGGLPQVVVPIAVNGDGAYAKYRTLQGTLIGVVTGNSDVATIARGDTFTVGAETYTCTTYLNVAGGTSFCAIKQD